MYVLTRTSAVNGMQPDDVNVFLNFKDAQARMLKDASDVYRSDDLYIGYDDDDITVGESHVYLRYGDPVYWKIYESDVELDNILTEAVAQEIFEMYNLPSDCSESVRKLSANCSCKWQDVGDFIQERVIGEELYEGAVASLGGKTDSQSTGVIFSYINQKLGENNSNWMASMLKLYSGDNRMVKMVREDIDRDRPAEDKIFQELQTYIVCCDKSKLQELQTLCDWVEETK